MRVTPPSTGFTTPDRPSSFTLGGIILEADGAVTDLPPSSELRHVHPAHRTRPPHEPGSGGRKSGLSFRAGRRTRPERRRADPNRFIRGRPPAGERWHGQVTDPTSNDLARG